MNIDAKTTIDFICGDFESAWDAIAHLPGSLNRGNFMFAMQTMILLEVLCRICEEKGVLSLQNFSKELESRNPLYFKRFPRPTPCDNKGKYSPNPMKQFWLPTLECSIMDEEKRSDAPLIGLLFYFIRHGLAHSYQQSLASLSSDKSKIFGFSLTGPDHMQYLRLWKGSKSGHLTFSEKNGNIWLQVNPANLYIDIKESSSLLNIDYTSRVKRKEERGKRKEERVLL